MSSLFFKRFLATAIGVACIATSPLALADKMTGDIEITNTWARPTVQGQQGGGGFVSFKNKGKTDDKLMSASSPAAARMELHTMSMEGNVMRMRQVPNIELKAGESVELKPGGMHLMFLDITKPLEKGTKVPVTFVFEKAGKVTVDVSVQPRAPEVK
jgi:periplasmic copper chaperone A